MNMKGYTKLFGSIVASTIWDEDNETRIVWITMLAMCDQFGVVDASIPGLAKFSKVPLQAVEAALDKFRSPDKYSRTQDYEGRRIEDVDGGWRLLNHAKYRAKMNSDERREYLRVKQQEFRRKHDVNKRNASSTPSTHSEADSEAEADTSTNTKTDDGLSPLVKRICRWFNRREATKWTQKEKRALKAVESLKTPEEDLALLDRFYELKAPYRRHDPITLMNNWNTEIDRAREWTSNPNRNGTADPRGPSVQDQDIEKEYQRAMKDKANDKSTAVPVQDHSIFLQALQKTSDPKYRDGL